MFVIQLHSLLTRLDNEIRARYSIIHSQIAGFPAVIKTLEIDKDYSDDR